MSADWAATEFQKSLLWDGRCRTTVTKACGQLAEQAQVSLSRALGSGRKAVSGLLHSEKVTASDLLGGHVFATASRCREHPLVLVASDTTVCDFTGHKAVSGLGPVSDKERQRGFFVHSALALTPGGLPLGLLHQSAWARDPAQAGIAGERRGRAFADKESRKWLDALRGVEAALAPDQPALLIQDREADVFSFFAAPRQSNVHLLIRAAQPRCLEADEPSTLFQAAAKAPPVASKTVPIHARPDREPRFARLCVRLLRTALRPPRNGSDPKAAPVPAFVVRAAEENPPDGVKEPIDWVLLTTLPEVDTALALKLVDYYALRWRIERFHYVLKSGCGYERLQCDTFPALRKALSLYSIVAWRLLHLTYLARQEPDLPAEDVLSAPEREVLERLTGKPLRTARDALLAVAKIAGFVVVPSAPVPGVKSLWLGFRKLQDIVAGFQLARQSITTES